MKKVVNCILFLAIALTLLTADSMAIDVGNPDFEEPAIAEGDYTYTMYPWIGVRGNSSYAPWISHAWDSTEPPPQSQVAYAENGIVYQELNATYAAGGIYIYSIDVSVWDSADTWQIFFFDADNGDYNTPLVSLKHTDPGQSDVYGWVQWDRKSLTFIPSAEQDGHKIGIGFAGGFYAIFDNATVEVPTKASFPDPYDGEEDVLINKTFSWQAGRDPNFPNLVEPSITDHNLYMSSGDPGDPNLIFVASIPVTGTEAQYDLPENLLLDATYYWRVDEVINDVNTIPGDVWMFKTAEAVPVIDGATPADILVAPATSPTLTVSAANPFTGSADDLSYQWYRVGTPDQMLADGAEYSGTQTADLTIIDVQFEDEGQYYCIVTNTVGNAASATSRSAVLTTKRLVGHWEFEDDATDSSPHGNNDGTLNGSPTFDTGIVGRAIVLDGVDDTVVVGSNGRPSDTFTFGGWFKTSSTHQIDAESTTGTGGTSGQRYAFAAAQEGNLGGAGLSVGTNGISVYEHGNSYMPAIAVYAAETGDQWNHIMVVYNNKQPTIYLNAQAVHTGLTSLRATVLAPVQFGGMNYGYFDGLMDDVRIYNYALEPLEVASLYLEVKPDETVCLSNPPMDFTGPDGVPDCIVDLYDFAKMASEFMQCNSLPDCNP